MPAVFFPAPSLSRLAEVTMARQNLRPADFGVTEDHDVFVDRCVDLLNNLYPAFSFDELLLRPKEALRYCDAVRQQSGQYDLPDDVVLRSVMNRRKRG